MCNGFGLIVTKDTNLLWCEPDSDGDCSHSEILSRANIDDNENQFLRNFVRVQFPNWTKESFEFDEISSPPAWAEENIDEIKAECSKIMARVYKVYADYEAKRDALDADYKAKLQKIKGYVKNDTTL